MPFQKGHKKVGGMQKGQISAKVQAWESLRDKLLNGLTDKAIDELSGLTGQAFLIQYSNLLEYFKPKLSRTELTGGNEADDKPIELIIKKVSE